MRIWLFCCVQISKETHSVLVEVTSSVSLDICKKVMDEFIKRTLEMGVGKCAQEGEDDATDSAIADDGEGK